jgi:hypothetical protein
LQFDRIHGPEVYPTTTIIEIIGDPGAGPPGHVLRVTNLDSDGPAVETTIAEDGSFQLQLSGDGGADELRFQTRLGRERDEPFDVDWSTLTVLPPERIPCVELEPLQQQDFGFVRVGAAPGTETIVVRNACSSDVELTAAGMRTPGSRYSIRADSVVVPTTVLPSGEESWFIEFSPTAVGPAEQIFFIELTVDGEPARYPITLYGDGE